ncbi:beta/gamma crystallin-related protein [Streptomyces clavuligerus]|uniref:Beta/gamma crystallin 'Greek key' domain-containing protein n=1 Tax=Streptomyces clavuligerus TaxID=1901 RepID=D5SKA5_STRCL|nr:beta/gamma crystallin-related protein [Streptomyces clavuligerus]ANW22279.1 hypothetical protein BB341_28515 [Streptomyces clavuligerus]AXU17174.1 hypothetical protein D1794_31590 [Streptomyces clavuligerus]EFG04348.1 Hypothetical protein SCLAV_p0862 [Streptomyces clavuligerus]MBY6307180.1 hypothetical protein [Streptomyces clavuligerus]QCS10242.1 hypothetical protein CRV15_32280 [Streptomyces clavuligerus]
MLRRLRSTGLLAGAASLLLALGTTGPADAAPQHQRFGTGGNLVAIVYEHMNFQGASLSLYSESCVFGEQHQNLPGQWNDQISSIRILGGCDLRGYEHTDHGGNVARWNRSSSYLAHWNDRISSVGFRI